MPSKPIRFGFKLFVLADSTCGYTVDFKVYLGKTTVVANNMPMTEAVVMDLTEPYLRQGYHLFVDNFYTSLPLLARLYDQGTRYAGTLRSNRGPPALRNDKAWAKRVERGDMRYKRVNDVLVVQWKDKKSL